jgi:hypothetical protein
VRLVADGPRAEAAFEDMSAAPVAMVEELGIAAVQVLHSFGQVRCRCLDDEVVVRAHEAVRVHLPVELVGGHREQVEEVHSVDVGDEDRNVADAVRRHVEDPVRKASSQYSRHLASTVARPERPPSRCAPLVTQSAQNSARPGPRKRQVEV